MTLKYRDYVYLPGRKDEWYQLNVSTIFHGVEGKRFRAWSVWDNVARPLIADAKVTVNVDRELVFALTRLEC